MAVEIVVSKLPEKSRGSLSLAFKLLNIGWLLCFNKIYQTCACNSEWLWCFHQDLSTLLATSSSGITILSCEKGIKSGNILKSIYPCINSGWTSLVIIRQALLPFLQHFAISKTTATFPVITILDKVVIVCEIQAALCHATTTADYSKYMCWLVICGCEDVTNLPWHFDL